MSPKGDQSRRIDGGMRQHVETIGRVDLRRQLGEGAERRAERDLALAGEWFAAEEASWTASSRRRD